VGTTQSNNLAQTPDNTPIADKDTGRVNFVWNQWFTNVQIKLNTITAAIIALSKNATAGFLSSDGAGGIFSRTLTAGTGITITNPTGAGGNPVISASGGAGGSPMHVTTNTATSYTAQLTDAPASTANVGWIDSQNSSANSINIDTNANVAFPIGTDIYVCQGGLGQTTIKALVGVTLNGPTITPAGQYGVGRAVQVAANSWRIFGNLAFQIYASYFNVVMSDNPLGYWRFGEASGTVANDSSSNAYNGTYVGGVTLGTTGLIATDTNTAITLNGSTGRVDVGAVAALYNLNRNFTIEWWMKPTNVTSYQGICSFGRVGTSGGVFIRLNTSGGLDILQDSVAALFSLTTNFVANTVYYCAFTVDASGNYVLYINGASAFTGTLSATFAGGYVTLGADSSRTYSTTLVEYFSGVLDEIAIYGTALSGTRISAHYAAA
jgi:hypothetical protein